ncbi:hypothetical protein AB1K84_06440 [Mesobacillus foraminis]|uniref:hypothetical protein n=1 Tax=Mesobacillus foraminis TaxID=279826 RepID=UPI0039A1509C
MSDNTKSELRFLNQVLFALWLTADYAYLLHLTDGKFPWFALLGAPVGLAIILLCWLGKKYALFSFVLVASAVVFSIAFNWNAIFSVH